VVGRRSAREARKGETGEPEEGVEVGMTVYKSRPGEGQSLGLRRHYTYGGIR
jgi:hypothetical protein